VPSVPRAGPCCHRRIAEVLRARERGGRHRGFPVSRRLETADSGAARHRGSRPQRGADRHGGEHGSLSVDDVHEAEAGNQSIEGLEVRGDLLGSPLDHPNIAQSHGADSGLSQAGRADGKAARLDNSASVLRPVRRCADPSAGVQRAADHPGARGQRESGR